MTETEITPTIEAVSLPQVPKPCTLNDFWVCGGGERWPETPEAANQRILLAELVSRGDYLKAISELIHNYASLVETMPSIIFMLRCRHFIELVRILYFYTLNCRLLSLLLS